MYDLIIIGAGCAGLTSAIYSCRYNLKTLVIGQDMGLLTKAHKVENWPGFRSISGAELMEKVKNHAESLGAKIVFGEIVSLVKKGKEFIVKSEGKEFIGKSVILALGTEKRKLNIAGEEKFLGGGVSYCATCDSAFFKGVDVGVVGGGNSAGRAAQLLSQHSSMVYLIYRGRKLNADPALVDELKKDKKIKILYNKNVVGLNGEGNLESVKLDSGEKIDVKGLFIEIGSIPSSVLTKKIGLKLDKHGYIKTEKDQSTNVIGLFAAGDITTNSNMFKQMVTAASEGAIAATSAFNYINKNK